MQQATKRDKVRVRYTGKLESGKVINQSKDSMPLVFQIGSGVVLSEFENAVIGMEVGEKKKITVLPEKIFGLKHDDLIMDIPRSEFPDKIEMFLGKRINVKVPAGGKISVKIESIDEETVRVDANPQSKGKAMIFDIELLEIL
jgi:peptidylprolyl isomerase